jgi:hypothetical protein
MGISDTTIHDIFSVTPSWVRCPGCTGEVFVCKVDMNTQEKVYYCPNPYCTMSFFDIDDNFMLEKDELEEKAYKMFLKLLAGGEPHEHH